MILPAVSNQIVCAQKEGKPEHIIFGNKFIKILIEK